ncbi:MAG TPA: hypothetical protein VMG38_19380 [Trebonia sp.]|nr:hypothetical protein [Trebonia sp.]
MSTGAGSKLSFLRLGARRRSRARLQARPAGPHLASPSPAGPGHGNLMQALAQPAPATMTASPSPRPCAPPPTMLARSLPDASLLSPEATIPTVLVPVIRTPTMAVAGQAASGEGSETTSLPPRRDAPATTIHPRRAR